MSWFALNRQTHRWVSILFTAIAALIFVSLGFGVKPPQWVYYLPLLPLAFLALTGLYMFFRPYFAGRRRFVRADAQGPQRVGSCPSLVPERTPLQASGRNWPNTPKADSPR